jgi:hypothetical protein
MIGIRVERWPMAHISSTLLILCLTLSVTVLLKEKVLRRTTFLLCSLCGKNSSFNLIICVCGIF